jgi:hydroxyacylglutathione hydrolase
MIYQDENIITLGIRTTNGSFINFCYIIYDKYSKEGILVDPSWEPDKINNLLYEHEIIIKHILLTHHHFDHINLSDYYTYTTSAPVWISLKEYEFYKPNLNNILLFNNHKEIQFGSCSCVTIVTPGHTAGSSCFKINNHLFCGDTLFPEGCGICTSLGGNPNEMFKSIQLLKKNLNKSVKIFPGHSYGSAPGIEFESVLKTNIYMQIDDEETFVKFRMRTNQKDFMEFH